jgi:hypothetical protein
MLVRHRIPPFVRNIYISNWINTSKVTCWFNFDQQTEFHKSFLLVFFLCLHCSLSLFRSPSNLPWSWWSITFPICVLFNLHVHFACYTKSALFVAVPLRCSLTDCGLFCSPHLLAISLHVLFYFLQLLWYCEGLQVVLQGEEYSWGEGRY